MMKMKMKMKNISHRYDKNRPTSMKVSQYDDVLSMMMLICIYLSMMMLLCIKQKLSNI